MLKPKALGLTLGTFWGVGAAVMMLVALTTGFGKAFISEVVGPLHPGFTFTYLGVLWMTVMHFIVGVVVGSLFAWLYNQFAK